jgi:DNA-binding response OmpR family regulator
MLPEWGLDILVVDDDARCLECLEDFLSIDGHRIRTATRGEEAVGIVRAVRRERRAFDLSILDIHVPDMNGLETFARLAELLPGIAVIFISGDSDDSIGRSVRDLGGLGLVSKPIDLDRVRGLIRRYSVGESNDAPG